MNRTATYVRNRLSLRPPQEQSLAILAELAEVFEVALVGFDGVGSEATFDLEVGKEGFNL